jgi:hypothetical protein
MNYTPAQILTTAILIVALVGVAFSQNRMLEIVFVLLLWGVVIAQVWRGPLQPPLLAFLRSDISGWHGSRYKVKLPADYIRLGEPVPESAITTWWVVHILLFIGCVVWTAIALTVGLFGWQTWLLTR